MNVIVGMTAVSYWTSVQADMRVTARMFSVTSMSGGARHPRHAGQAFSRGSVSLFAWVPAARGEAKRGSSVRANEKAGTGVAFSGRDPPTGQDSGGEGPRIDAEGRALPR
jgi:hypothetical protein